MDASQVIIRPGRLGEELRARRDRQVHVPRPRRTRTRRRSARPSSSSSTCSVRDVRTVIGEVQAEAPRLDAGRTRTWKKAIVQLAPGDTIPIFRGPGGQPSDGRSASPSRRARAGASSPIPTSPRSRATSRRSRSSRA